MDNKKKTRVQFSDFTTRHFDISPVWEFATDEEAKDGQDETTLKPRIDLSFADPSKGVLIVECEFESNSGKKFSGLCSPSFDNSLSNIQPYILADNHLVMFWFGISQPDKETKDRLYNILRENPEGLFPLKFSSKLTKPDGSKILGQINGFMWMTLPDRKVTTEK
jgi:hypothetical protein